MFREGAADVFIKTLAEMLEMQRAGRSARLRRQYKAQAERFMQTYGQGPDDGLHALTWTTDGREADDGLQGQT